MREPNLFSCAVDKRQLSITKLQLQEAEGQLELLCV